MTASSEAEVLARAVRNPGKLVLGPTSVSSTFPYGGVEIGPHRDGEVEWHFEYIPTRDPASGMMREVGRAGIEWPEIYCILDGTHWDEDFLQGVFKASTRLDSPEPAEVRIQGSATPALVGAWPPVLFAADEPNSFSIYIPRPIPTLSLRQSVYLSRSLRAGLPVRLTPTLNADYATVPPWQCCRLENVVL